MLGCSCRTAGLIRARAPNTAEAALAPLSQTDDNALDAEKQSTRLTKSLGACRMRCTRRQVSRAMHRPPFFNSTNQAHVPLSLAVNTRTTVARIMA